MVEFDSMRGELRAIKIPITQIIIQLHMPIIKT